MARCCSCAPSRARRSRRSTRSTWRRGRPKRCITPAQILKGAEEKLSQAERAQRERQRISTRGFTSYQLSDDGKLILVSLSGKLYVVRRADNDVTALDTGKTPALNPTWSPDATKIAYVHERDLYVYDLAKKRETRLTKSTDPAISNGLAEFVAQEEMRRVQGFWWAPDGKSLAYEEADNRGVEQLTHPRRGASGAGAGADLLSAPGQGQRQGAPRPHRRRRRGDHVGDVGSRQAAVPGARGVARRGAADAGGAVARREDAAGAGGRQGQDARARRRARRRVDRSRPRHAALAARRLGLSVVDRAGRRLADLAAARRRRARWCARCRRRRRTIAGSCTSTPRASVAWFEGSPTAPETQVYRVSLDGGARGGADERPRHPPGATWRARATGACGSSGRRRRRRMWRALVHVDDEAGKSRVAGELPSVSVKPPFMSNEQLERVGDLGYWTATTRPRNFDPKRKYPVVVDVYAGPGASAGDGGAEADAAVDGRSRRHRRRHRRARHAGARPRLGALHRRRLLAHDRRSGVGAAGARGQASRDGPDARRHHRLVVRRLRVGAGGA